MCAKHSRFVAVQDSLAIVADSDFSRYKDGTRSTGALVFLKRFLRYMQSDRCLLSSFVCNRLTPFHGGNTGSNPVGDANKTKHLARTLFFRWDTAGTHNFS